jgi:hypothetical protein
LAEAEARATQFVSDAIAAGNIHAINYFIANNYVGALKELAKSPNQKVLMIPVDAASVIGSIAGITEITREAFGGSGGGNSGGGGGTGGTSEAEATGPKGASRSGRSVPSVRS